MFISKLNPAGTALLYSSVIGGFGGSDKVVGIKVNSSGEAYIAGTTESFLFPTVNAIQPTLAGFADAFILKLSRTGSAIIYSTYLGGNNNDVANGFAIDGNDNVLIVGSTVSTDFPLANPLQPSIHVQDAFITKLNSTGSAFIYSTYLGGSTTDIANDVAVDAAGNAYIVGTTQSGDFPLLNPVQSAIAEQTLLKSTNGGASWAPLISGLPAATSVYDIEIDPTNPATLYLAGYTDDVYKSTNSGMNWSALHLPREYPSIINEIEIAPSNPSTVYAGLSPEGVRASTDGGASWSARHGSFIEKNYMAVSPTVSTQVYISDALYGMAESTDGGMSFDDLGVPNRGARIRSLAMTSSNPDAFYIGTERGLWKYTRTATGGSWNFIGLFTSSIGLIVIDPSNPNTLYVNSSTGLLKSTNSGTTWSNLSISSDDASGLETLAVDPGNSSILYAGKRNGLVYKSVDGGIHWSKLLENPVGSGGVKKIEIDPSSTNTVYVGAAVGGEAFVTKINPTGSALLFSTYFGGKGYDLPAAIAVDPVGNPIIVGQTGSGDLPTTSLQTYKGNSDAFVTKFDIANHRLAYSAYLGGSGIDTAYDVDVDTSGNIYVTGSTLSSDFPLTPDAIPLPNNGACQYQTCQRAFVTKLNASGSAYLYSTLLGGSGLNIGRGIAVDLANNAYVTGYTTSADFPTTPNAYDRELGGVNDVDAFIVKISPFSTCLKDDTNGNILRINSIIGEFEFANCRKGWVVKGPLTTTVRGCKTELTSGGRTGLQLSALINTCTKQGNATIIVDGKSYTIADSSITGNECTCSTP